MGHVPSEKAMISDQNGEIDSVSSHEPAIADGAALLRGGGASREFQPCGRRAVPDPWRGQPRGAIARGRLGVALFQRRSRRVFLTDAGRKLAQAVHDGLGLMRHAAQELRTEAARARRWVLSCEPTLLMRWLIPRWPDFQARHAGVDIHLAAAGGPFSFDSGIDMAIRRNDFAWPAGYHAERCSRRRWGRSAGRIRSMRGFPRVVAVAR